MIEITHESARRLLRQEVDGRLPEGQWPLLTAHLEGCAECRAYQRRLSRLGKDLRKAMLAGRELAPRPGEGLAQAVSAARRARLRREHQLVRAAQIAGIAGVLVLLFLALGGTSGIARLFARGEPIPVAGKEPASAPPDAAQYRPLVTQWALPTLLPTARAGEFPGVVVYEARRDGRPDGDSEIYLLNPGTPPVDISNHPGEDTQPAWSPDGEWIAFLSERASAESGATGAKSELYVISMTGRVVQLTDQPEIDWQGPLSWSPDGRSIALTGLRRAQGGLRWVYLVPLDGSGPRAVAGTRGGDSPKFSPNGELLAFGYSDGEREGLAVLRLAGSGEPVAASWPENRLSAPPVQGGSFDWSPEGTALVYIASRSDGQAGEGQDSATAGSEMVVVQGLNYSISQLMNSVKNARVASSAWPSAYRAVSWGPGAVVYLEDQGDARARQGPADIPGECYRVQVRPVLLNRDETDSGIFTVGGLCVEGGLDSGSWSEDAGWLVVLGRIPGDSRRAIYAVRMPERPYSTAEDGASQAGPVLRLADEPFTASLPRVRPRLRSGSTLNIDPRPAGAAKPPRPLSDLSARAGGPPGQLLYVSKNHQMSVLAVTNPDGYAGRVLYSSQEQARCPRWSPDGAQVALLLAPPNSTSAGNGGDASVSIGGRGGQLRSSAVPPGTNRPLETSGPAPAGEEIYLLDVNGGGTPNGAAPRRISDRMKLPESGPEPVEARYGCPVWSPADAPGGPYLAAQISTPRASYLVVIPSGGGLARYVNLGGAGNSPAVSGLGPVWSADGRSLYLAQITQRGDPRLLEVRLPEDAQAALSLYVLPSSADLRQIAGLAVSPDTPYLALLTLTPGVDGMSPVFLRQLNLSSDSARPVERAPLLMGMTYDDGTPRPNRLAWLPGGALGLVLHSDPGWRTKALISYYEPSRRQVVTLASVEDVLSELAWSPDGRWLVYSTESGLWGLDVAAARDGRAAPVWLSPVPVEDLDWK